MIYYSNLQACLMFIKDRNIAYMAVEGFLESGKVKDLMQKTVELCLKQKVHYLLIDSSRLEVVKTDDIRWIVMEIYPLLRQTSLKKVGYVRSQNVFGQVSLEKLLPKNTTKEIKFFSTLELAESWLLDDNSKDGLKAC
ncbi:MAG TPA: hypothetical protein DCQ26_09130 [Marinilabiliales bacterium]|nr:MAG: hypothetical protein A2W95_13815 [Bacteroidetes bacterium GWA2_40_14]OFX58670.1 MAG: hypothetical protein A2W84_12820 [Bacteroidetes bacterium GWC2_40_13]OFX76249.1 MAG: hypothetical protein A2W96_03405 [Bacteroidetes bacterium GWD2_40_43]OFX95492.1 MAG: hypothetical protein A2W97_11655 [Bacteroidetes bacterium GWE2_40_63]OFY19937.1 MAG: hypothetical protein A2W88_04815 [Bacteroidetes bacterium GWF2_40_13]OFZ23925.1 MAG: hypothetical protein A2437_10320 [Bacteroidetes bacterium RIFOXYC